MSWPPMWKRPRTSHRRTSARHPRGDTGLSWWCQWRWPRRAWGTRGPLTYRTVSGMPWLRLISCGPRRAPPPQPFSSDPPLVALVHTLLGQQLVAVSPSQKPPNARAYVQHKNEHKCSLILPMLDLNARCVDPLPFKLPTLVGLAHLLQLCALRGEQLFYCTLDISNHF